MRTYGCCIALVLVVALVHTGAMGTLNSVTNNNSNDGGDVYLLSLGGQNDGELVNIDRTHTFDNLPGYMQGIDYVQTANDDKTAGSVSVDVTFDAGTRLYLSIDDRINVGAAMPWVGTQGWTDTGDGWEKGEDSSHPFSVYSLDPAGTAHTFHEQDDGGSRNMYSISAGPGPPPPVPLNDALEAYWPLDETSGNLVDVIGGNVGTPVGSPHGDGSNGVIGGALELDGSPHYVTVPHDPSVDFGTESFTVSFWVDGDGVSNDDRFVQKGTVGDGSESGKRYDIYYKNDEMRFGVDDDVTKSELQVSSEPFVNGDFVHVAAVRDTANGVLRLYADGTLVGTKTDSTGSISQTEGLTLGNDHQRDNGFRGRLDDVALFRRALTPAEIAFLATGQSPNQAVEITSFVSSITTADGNGADAEVRENNDESGGSGTSDRINARYNDDDRNEYIFLRFDLSALDPGSLVDAALNLTSYRDNGSNRTIRVFGLNEDVLGQDWDEATIEFDGAPALVFDGDSTTRGLVDADVTRLGDWDLPDLDEGDLAIFDDADLIAFLNADTDGLVTLILQRRGDSDGQDRFASKEADELDSITGSVGDFAPYLQLAGLRVSPVVVIPEPVTMAMLGLALAGLGGYIRRRRRA